jgi:hypothetical protein
MATEYMDPDKVFQMASGFGTAADILKRVSQVLEIQMRILLTTAFMGNVGGVAVERYLSIIKPQIDQLAKKCEEVSSDLNNAAKAWIAAGERN